MTDRRRPLLRGPTAAVVCFVLVAVLLGAAVLTDSGETGSARKGLIAFVSTSSGTAQLHTVLSDGTGLQQLTDDAASVGSPQWSPDGKRLLVLTGCANVSGPCPDPTRFATMRPDGSDRVDIAGTKPAFSPDGRRLAYLVCSGTSCDLYVANANGRNQVHLDTAAQRPFWPGEPAWASDSKQLLYLKAATPSDTSSIWLADLRARTTSEVLAGVAAPVSTPVFFPNDMSVTYLTGFAARLFSISVGETEPMRRGLAGETGYIVQSPTRTRFAVQAFSNGPGGFIAAYNGDLNQFGEFAIEFRAPKPNSHDPVWSPDGARIAYTFCDRSTTVFPGGPCSIDVVGLGSDPSTIYSGPLIEGSDWVCGYDWSPDSSALVLSVSESGGPFRLHVVDADGSGLAQLLPGSDNQYAPAWQP